MPVAARSKFLQLETSVLVTQTQFCSSSTLSPLNFDQKTQKTQMLFCNHELGKLKPNSQITKTLFATALFSFEAICKYLNAFILSMQHVKPYFFPVATLFVFDFGFVFCFLFFVM